MTTTPATEPTPSGPPAAQAGNTPHTAPNPLYDRLLYGKTPSDWAIRIVLALVMTAALAVGTWSIYTLLTQQLHAPQPIAILGCGMFDVAALFFALLAQQYAVTTDSGLAPRLAMLAMVSTSSWVNWKHGQLEHWDTVGSVILAAAPVIAELAFEMFHRFAHRETLRRLGRVAQTLPILGKWAWIAHPFRSRKTIDSHIKAALTEHEAVASRREDLATERAALIVTVPVRTAIESARTEWTVTPVQHSADRTALDGPHPLDRTSDWTAGNEWTGVDRTATEDQRTADHSADRTTQNGPDRQTADVDRTGRTTTPDQDGPQTTDREDRTDATRQAPKSTDHTDRGPAHAQAIEPDHTVQDADHSADRTDDDLTLTDLEQTAIDFLRSNNRSISKRSIAEVVRTELGGSIASDRAAEIARHFRTLRPAA
ncbi:DUF2637 domain-containing protein [Streptomyces lydicus]|uniref:DUF2637 domain-containing protein n=1 Tax=Streptomyces lydicus TaxID=47763 RepID=UPI0037BD1F0A